MLTYFQAQDVLEALNLAKKLGEEITTEEQDKLIDKSIKHIMNAIKDGMPIGDHEDDIQEDDDDSMSDHRMRSHWQGSEIRGLQGR